MSYPKNGVLESDPTETEGEVVDLSNGQRFRINDISVEYAGTTTTQVDLMDGDGGDVIDTIHLEGGEDFSAQDLMRTEIEDSVYVSTDGNEDGEMFITVGGEVTSG